MKTIFAYGEQHQLDLLNAHLSQLYFFRGFTCSNSKLQIDEYSSIRPDLILIHKKANSLCNIEFIQRLRSSSASSNIPLIAISDDSSDDELELTLTSGADDFISAPFTQKQLLARTLACLRRGLTFTVNNEVKYKSLSINKNNKTVEVEGRNIYLTPIEYRILSALLEQPDILIDRDLLIDSCFLKGESKSFSLNVHMFALRKKLGTAGSYIHTVRGNGYKLN